jgi:hypothetical protein
MSKEFIDLSNNISSENKYIEHKLYNLLNIFINLTVNKKGGEPNILSNKLNEIRNSNPVQEFFGNIDYFISGSYSNNKNFDNNKIQQFDDIHLNLITNWKNTDITHKIKISNDSEYLYWFLFREYSIHTYLESFDMDFVLYPSDLTHIRDKSYSDVIKNGSSLVNYYGIKLCSYFNNFNIVKNMSNDINISNDINKLLGHKLYSLINQPPPQNGEPILINVKSAISSIIQNGGGIWFNFESIINLLGYNVLKTHENKMFWYKPVYFPPNLPEIKKTLILGTIYISLENINTKQQTKITIVDVTFKDNFHIKNDYYPQILSLNKYNNIKHYNILDQINNSYTMFLKYDTIKQQKNFNRLCLFLNLVINEACNYQDQERIKNDKSYMNKIRSTIETILENETFNKHFVKYGFVFKFSDKNSFYGVQALSKIKQYFNDIKNNITLYSVDNIDKDDIFTNILLKTFIHSNNIAFYPNKIKTNSYQYFNDLDKSHETYIRSNTAIFKSFRYYTNEGYTSINEHLSKLFNNDTESNKNIESDINNIQTTILNVPIKQKNDYYITLFSVRIPFIINFKDLFDINSANKYKTILLPYFISTSKNIKLTFLKTEYDVLLVILAKSTSKIISVANNISIHMEEEYILPYGSTLDVFHVEYKNIKQHSNSSTKIVYCYYNDPDPRIIDIPSFKKYINDMNTSNNLQLKKYTNEPIIDIKIPNKGIMKSYNISLIKIIPYFFKNISPFFNIFSTIYDEFFDISYKCDLFNLNNNKLLFSTAPVMSIIKNKMKKNIDNNIHIQKYTFNFSMINKLQMINILNVEFINDTTEELKKLQLDDEYIQYINKIPNLVLSNNKFYHQGNFINMINDVDKITDKTYLKIFNKEYIHNGGYTFMIKLINYLFDMNDGIVCLDTPSIIDNNIIYNNVIYMSEIALKKYTENNIISTTGNIYEDPDENNYVNKLLDNNYNLRSIFNNNKIYEYFNNNKMGGNDICDSDEILNTISKCKIINYENEMQTLYANNSS